MVVRSPRLRIRPAYAALALLGAAVSTPVAAAPPPAPAQIETITPLGQRIITTPQTGTIVTITQEGQVLAAQASPPGRPGQPQPRPLNSLKAGLDSVAWDPAERGPLLAVAPENAGPAWLLQMQRRLFVPGQQIQQSPQPPQAASNGQYRLPDLADYFGRRIVRLNGITVAAPGTMVVFNTNPGKPDLYAGLNSQEKLRMLEASLTGAQWKTLGSEQGLGVHFSRITDWAQAIIMADYEQEQRLKARIRHSHPQDYIPFASDDPLVPTDAEMAKIAEGWKGYVGRGVGTAFPVADLSPNMQAAAREAIASENARRAAVATGRDRGRSYQGGVRSPRHSGDGGN